MTRRLMVNGEARRVSDEHPHLLAALRDELGLTAAKDGCSPSGQCGCCTVIIDGKAVVSCQQPLDRLDGKQIVTLEGVAEAERARFAHAFAACGGLQCGFCIPGIVMRAKAQIDRKGAGLQRADMARHLGAHLCRCTGYVKILDAIEAVAQGDERAEVAPSLSGAVGVSGAKYEGVALTLGDRGYVSDIRVPAMVHAALALTAHARADITAIDTAAAGAAPGVVGVFTAADVPGELRVGLIHRDWPVLIPVDGRTSYAGDVLAVVVAATREQARAAAALVEVAYAPLVPFTDPFVALASADPAVWGTESNTLSVSAYTRGDVDAALAASAHVVTETFITQRVEHAFLEPESTLAVPVAQPDGERGLHLYTGGQGVWDDRDQVASVLGIPRDRVHAELVSNGGAFGGKEDLSNQAHAALAAWLLDRPVMCTLSREESLLIHAKRHPITMEVTAGCDASGHLTGMRFRAVGDSGAYASVGMKVLERAAGHCAGPYRWPALDVRGTAVRTNNPVCGAFRGFGANQAQFATEGVIDRLAELAGVDPWEMRKRNVVRPGEEWGPGQIMDDGVGGAEACLDAIEVRYRAARASGQAVGLGLGMKNSGLGNGFDEITQACIRFAPSDPPTDPPSGGPASGDPVGMIDVWHGWTEMGQGIHTVAVQVAAQELGVDPARIRVHVDTRLELGRGQTTGSRGTLMGAGAVADACRIARADGCRPGVDYLGEHRVNWTHKLGTPGVEHPTIHSAFSYAAQLVVVDRDSGKVERVVAVHDVGHAVNPLLCEGQVEGSVHMGLGYALSEDFPTDPATGFPTNMTLRSLGILRAKDVPAIEVELVEVPQPRAPFGIKGVGEIGLVPTAPAVAAALHDLDGRWRARLPLARTADTTDTAD